MTYQGQVFNVGQEVISKLKTSGRFGFRDYSDEQEARLHVRQGKLAFALIIPRDFSANAIPGVQAGAGKPLVFTSEGNNFESAAIARHFAESLGHQINESLNERRWALVLDGTASAQNRVQRLHEGLSQLSQGAKQLKKGAKQTAAGAHAVADGNERLNAGVGQLTVGMKQLGAGLKTMEARLPPRTDLIRLQSGAEALAAGHGELAQGMVDLQNGSSRLSTGMTSLREEARGSIFIPAAAVDGVEQLADGMFQIDSGLTAASNAQQKLSEGASLLSTGVGSLTNGMLALDTGLQTAAGKLPEEALLDDLATGASGLASGASHLSSATQQLASGSQKLASGIEQLAAALPARIEKLDGSPRGLANSVEPELEMAAAVANSGSGFAPNMIPGALWLGAGIAAFLLHVRVLPHEAKSFSRPAQLLGKIFFPALVVLLQAALIFVTVLFILKIHVIHPAAFALSLGVASLTFMLIVFALTRAFGDAGKGLAMILLAVQLSSSGGIVPIELSGGLFMGISPWLPLTWVVRALKASMFGAYEGAWAFPLLMVGVAAMAAIVMGCTVGRWRFVHPEASRPAVDF